MTEVQHIPSLKNKDSKSVLAEVALVNGLLHNLSTVNISESNRLLYVSAFVGAERFGMTKKRREKSLAVLPTCVTILNAGKK